MMRYPRDILPTLYDVSAVCGDNIYSYHEQALDNILNLMIFDIAQHYLQDRAGTLAVVRTRSP